ncbi:RIP metalloprotease RseP [Limnobacter humi]|uniref:Zinc metalloprotease n=1 Tax=Limnobacter humi TaxID=1778671 RepID=A0ABT1WEU6_9BURK|nr:RIP metalloprotease RseP [Limnobacter humi]MCQ8896029.1 RIP metalloprotease RseP [Limnobacter humi]
MLNSLVSFLVALGILVFIHEWGHYAVARYCGVQVMRFSVGFGRPLFRWVSRKTGVEWVVSWIPLGGYVRMLDERDPESLTGAQAVDLDRAFNRKPVGHRFAIVLAGPVANLLLAGFLYALLNYSQPGGVATTVASPSPGSFAEQMGLRAQDRIQSVNGQSTPNWGEVSWALLKAKLFSQGLVLTIERNGSVISLQAPSNAPLPGDIGPTLNRDLGLMPFERKVLVGSVAQGSPAEKAGFQRQDQLLTVDHVPVQSAAQFTRLIQDRPAREVQIELIRGNETITVTATPEAVASNGPGGTNTKAMIGRLGLGIGGQPDWVEHPRNALSAIQSGFGRMVEVSVFSLAALVKMIMGELSVEHLSGPVSIAAAAGESSSLGILPFIAFLAMVSVSLGVLNLLPIPLLDGGHLMYYLAEIVRGKPVSEQVQMWGQKIGMTVIALLTSVALFNDIHRLL